MSQIVHAGLIALYDGGHWRGVLIEGPSGAGKSDLALRALRLGFRLVADDRVTLWTSEGRLYGAAPPSLAGLVEVRGLDVIPAPRRAFAQLRLVVACTDEAPERIPEPQTRVFLGVACPLIKLRPLEASAPEKLVEALSLLGGAP